MLKKVLVPLVTCLFLSNANAMQVNLSLGDDIKSNNQNLNIEYHIYSAQSPGKITTTEITMNDFELSAFAEWLTAFNQEVINIKPTDDLSGQHSRMTLGYMKDGAKIIPFTCQDIRLGDATTIKLSESGCVVS